MSKLILKDTKVVFYNPIDQGFGTSITIAVTAENRQGIADFWAANNIGNEKTVIGQPNFKDYEGTTQLSVKINQNTKYAGLGGLGIEDIGFGSTIDFVINAFAYNNKFTKGKEYIGASVSAILIKKSRSTGGDADLQSLMQDLGGTEGDGLPF